MLWVLDVILRKSLRYFRVMDEADEITQKVEGIVDQPDANILRHLTERRTRRNDLLPLFQLPHELLIKILSFSIYDPWNEGSHVAKLHSLAQVSTRFANLVKYSPSLWNIVSDYNPSDLPLIITKSKDASLDIFFNGKDHSSLVTSVFQGMVLHQSHRWRSVTFSASKSEFGQRLMEQLPAPRLRTLRIRHWKFWERKTVVVRGEKLRGLHHLTLSGVFVKFGSGIPSGLRTLELRELREGGRPSLTEILAVLRASPELNRLELGCESLESSSQANGITEGSLELPYLLSLKLDLGWEMVQTVLTYLRFPNCIDMAVTARPPSSPSISIVLPAHVIDRACSIIAAKGQPVITLTTMTAALVAGPAHSEALYLYLPLPLEDQIQWVDTTLESAQLSAHPIALEAKFHPLPETNVPTPPIPSHIHHITSLQLAGMGEGVVSWLKLLSEPVRTDSECGHWHLPCLEDLDLEIWLESQTEALLTMLGRRYGRDTQLDEGSIPSDPAKIGDQEGIANEYYNDRKASPSTTSPLKLPVPLEKLTIQAHPHISKDAAQELESIIGRGKVSWERLPGITYCSYEMDDDSDGL
ncbi:hypothetical protein FRB93_006856 [Tulasnella sp. JGI-2019a]|nr:hypothetical protein FRB93_006856 [Tulasnella sp. JGI-2019a]